MRRPTPVSWEELRVGLFLLGGLVLLAGGIFYIGQSGHVFGRRYNLVTLMESAAGLVPGAAVQLAGQNVGQVSRIEWIEPERRQEMGEAVAVWLAVNEEVAGQIRSDSRARLRTQGLLGDRVIDIEPGSADSARLEPGDTLRSDEPVDYELVLEQASSAVKGLTDLTEGLEELTRRLLAGEGSLGQLVVDETLYRRMGDLAASLNGFLERVNAGEGSLGRLLDDSVLYENLSSMTARLDSVTARVAAGEGSLGRLVVSDSLYREVLSTVGHADSLLARLEAGEGSAGKLVTDDALYEELLRSLVELNAILLELRADPGKYVPPLTVF